MLTKFIVRYRIYYVILYTNIGHGYPVQLGSGMSRLFQRMWKDRWMEELPQANTETGVKERKSSIKMT